MSARPRKEPDTSTYPGRIAARLGELLARKGWTISEAAERITAAGEPISEAALGYYLRGERELPLRYVPVIAQIFGYKSAGGWLPDA